jgi:hypothetical protein
MIFSLRFSAVTTTVSIPVLSVLAADDDAVPATVCATAGTVKALDNNSAVSKAPRLLACRCLAAKIVGWTAKADPLNDHFSATFLICALPGIVI